MQFKPGKPVRSGRPADARGSRARAGGLWFMLLSAGAAAWATEPHIDYIELLGTNLVTIHFNTDANRTYTLQCLDHLITDTNTTPSGTWSNLTVIPAIPFNNHYVLVDNRTNQNRFYRLSVTP